MAANYWASTQRRHWQFTRQTLAQIRDSLEEEDKDLIQQYPLPDRRLLSQFFCHQLSKLGKRLSVRQQALATAQVYMKRFYTKVEVQRTNPYLLIATALYLACKMEECPQHIRVVVSEARQTWPGHLLTALGLHPADFIFSDIAKLGEYEFYLISELNSHLIIHHPYRTLTDLTPTLNIAQDEVNLAWSIINDHYLTDLPLLHPPHVIAISAIILAMTLKPTPGGLTSSTPFPGSIAGQLVPPPIDATVGDQSSDQTSVLSPQQKKVQGLVTWLAEGEVEIGAVIECSQEIISLYETLEQYSEKACKEQISRFVKARGLDK